MNLELENELAEMEGIDKLRLENALQNDTYLRTIWHKVKNGEMTMAKAFCTALTLAWHILDEANAVKEANEIFSKHEYVARETRCPKY